MLDYFRWVFSQLIASLLALASGGATAMVLGKAFGLFRESTTTGVPGFYEVTTISIIDEGTIAFMASLAASVLCAQVAAKDAPVGRAGIIGLLSGVLVGGIVVSLSKMGLNEGAPMAIAALVAAIAVGLGLRAGFKMPAHAAQPK